MADELESYVWLAHCNILDENCQSCVRLSLRNSLLQQNHLTLCLLCIIFHAFFSSAEFFQNQLFRKILSGLSSECQTVWIQIRPDKMSGLIWVQTVCKYYQQTTKVGKEFKPSHIIKVLISLCHIGLDQLKKTCVQGFWPSKAQASLISYRDQLEYWNVTCICYISN